MLVLKSNTAENPHEVWVEAVIEGRWVLGKVFIEPSTYGINNGRVSKLSIGKTDTRDRTREYFPQIAYHYDRGLDFDELGVPGLLEKVVAQLEAFRIANPYVIEDIWKNV